MVLVSVCGAACGVRSQTPVSVAEYREAVLRHSYEVRTAELGAEASGADVRRLRARMFPQLGAEAGFQVDFRRAHSGGHAVEPYSFTVQPSVSQVIYAGGSARNTWARAATEHEVSQENLSAVSLQTVYGAEYCYWKLASDEALLQAAASYVEIVASLLEVVASRFEDGYISKSDVLMVQARKNEAEYSLHTQRRAYLSSLHDFNTRMGRSPQTEAVLADSIMAWMSLPGRVPVDEILSRRPDYLAARGRVRMSEYDVKLSRAEFDPRVSAGVTGVWNTLSPNLDGTTRVDGFAFVRLSVPIFGWGQRRNSVRAAEALSEAARMEMLHLRDEIARQESDAWSAIEQSAQQLRESYDGLSIAAENLSLSTFAYNEGQLTVLDVLSAQLSWIQIYTNTISAAASLRMAIADYRSITADTSVR